MRTSWFSGSLLVLDHDELPVGIHCEVVHRTGAQVQLPTDGGQWTKSELARGKCVRVLDERLLKVCF